MGDFLVIEREAVGAAVKSEVEQTQLSPEALLLPGTVGQHKLTLIIVTFCSFRYEHHCLETILS